MSVDGLGNPVRFILTAGNVNDIVQAEALIRGLSFDKLLADKGYDFDRFRTSIAQVGAEAVIPIDPLPIASHPLRQACLPGSQSGRAILQQDQTFSSNRHTLRKDRALIRFNAISGRGRDLAQVNVNRS